MDLEEWLRSAARKIYLENIQTTIMRWCASVVVEGRSVIRSTNQEILGPINISYNNINFPIDKFVG